VFERAPTWGFMVDDEPLYARARRLWCVQILDPVLLRWDALNGLPGTNWVTVLSPGFTAAHGLMLDDLCAAIESLAESGVHHLRGSQGIAIAGGDCPLLGDINIGDNIGPYLSTSRVLRLLLLTGASVHAGPLHYPERWRSWLLRFVEPQAWLAGIGRR